MKTYSVYDKFGGLKIVTAESFKAERGEVYFYVGHDLVAYFLEPMSVTAASSG